MATDADLYQTIRAAIATKAAADIATLRRATATRTRIRGPLPGLKVFLPSFVMDGQPNAWIEQFTLTYPGEVIVAAPAGTDRAELEVITLARGLQVAWWSDTQLGLADVVQHSWISTMQPAVDEYDRLVGFAPTWQVRCYETLSSARSTT